MIIKVLKVKSSLYYKYIIPIKDYTIIIRKNNNITRENDSYFTMGMLNSCLKYKITINDNLYKMLLSEDMTILNMGVSIIMKKYII